jgi:hypothetical protein
MTLIVTHISKYGIIHASDSNLTASGLAAGEGKKTFPIPDINAGLTIAGSYSVFGVSMDSWMNEFIQTHTGLSLAVFADTLKCELESQMSKDEKTRGTIIHLAGYAKMNGVSHPELWHIRNVGINPHNGEYTAQNQFHISEDFWSRDCPRSNLMQEFQKGSYQIYVNGFASGRTSFMILQPIINKFFSEIWGNPAWKFRPPASINETETLVKLYIQIIESLFIFSDYSAPFIGGDPQTYAIQQPLKIVTTC